MKRVWALLLAAGAGLIIGLGGVCALRPFAPRWPLAEGLTIAGQAVPPDSAEVHSWLAAHRAAVLDRQVAVRFGDLVDEKASPEELGVTLDVDQMAQQALAVAHTGTLLDRWREAARARRGEIDIPNVWRFDQATARQYLERFAPRLERAPVDAQLDLAGHRKIADKDGQELNLEATVAALSTEELPFETVDLIVRVIPAEITLHDLGNLDPSKVLGRYETRFAVYEKGRSANVALAAGKLDGLVIRPGAIVSFNDRVGPRTMEQGFQQAPEIVGDELTVGIGGGTCQVSSTLHAAALFGGLTIVQRKSHTRPSSYTQLGLDATVAYPVVDLKIQNPFKFTVAVHATVPEPGLLRVELLGGEEVDSVEYKYGVARIASFVRRITVKPWLKPGRGFRKQKGTRGMDVHSFLTLRYRDGHVETRRYYSGYKATPEVFWVAPDYDEANLPPLPEHALGVEGRLHLDGSDVYPPDA